MAVLTFKFDESYKTRSMVIGGWIGNDTRWKRREKLWRKALAYENRTLPNDRKLSSYHAAEMNANDGEYKGWENEIYRKLRFTKKLLKIAGSDKMIPVAAGIDLLAFDDIFPDRYPPGLGTAYTLCLKALMQQLGEALSEYRPDDRLAIIHDHGDWDHMALTAYNQSVDDPLWPDRHRFVSITPLTWQDDAGLQSSDLFVYEAMRYLDDHNWTGEDMRKPLKVLFGLMNRAAFGFYINRRYLELLRKELENEGKLDPLPRVQKLQPDHEKTDSGQTQRHKSQDGRGESRKECKTKEEAK
jgi:hypothetical protein